MKKTSKKANGIEVLIKKYQKIFRKPENIEYYSKQDFRIAERKFLKWALAGGESNREQL